MMPRIRHLPPTAVPIAMRDLWSGLAALARPERALSRLRSELQARTGRQPGHFLASGQAALTTILLGLKTLSDRSSVVIPAYTCPSVVQSVLKAGLEPVACDVSPRTMDLDRDALHALMDSSVGANVLAMVPTHLYGWAQDVRDLVSVGRELGVFVVEDAAQALGASFQGRMVGTWGEAGFYSLGRGKCLPAGGGGVIVASARCAPAIESVAANVPGERRRVRRDLGALALFLGYGLATRPVGWWFIARSPLNPANERMDADTLPPIMLESLSPVRAAIAASMMARIDEVHAIRRRNAERLISLLSRFRFLTIPEIPPDSKPVFLRLPVIVDSPEMADLLFRRLDRDGVGVSRSYHRTLPDMYPGSLQVADRGFPGASTLATRLLTLPTHGFLQERDFDTIATVFRSLDQRARSSL